MCMFAPYFSYESNLQSHFLRNFDIYFHKCVHVVDILACFDHCYPLIRQSPSHKCAHQISRIVVHRYIRTTSVKHSLILLLAFLLNFPLLLFQSEWISHRNQLWHCLSLFLIGDILFYTILDAFLAVSQMLFDLFQIQRANPWRPAAAPRLQVFWDFLLLVYVFEFGLFGFLR